MVQHLVFCHSSVCFLATLAAWPSELFGLRIFKGLKLNDFSGLSLFGTPYA
jgi:hypothetical protein